jgi:septal ring factor EnvC (AmiA/AmiB activator)
MKLPMISRYRMPAICICYIVHEKTLQILSFVTNLSALREQDLKRFAPIQADLQELRALVENIRSEQSKTRIEIMDRIDRLQTTIEMVREDARVNWATADTAINRAKNSRADIDDLQGQISAMERRYQTLAAVVDELRKSEPKKPD